MYETLKNIILFMKRLNFNKKILQISVEKLLSLITLCFTIKCNITTKTQLFYLFLT